MISVYDMRAYSWIHVIFFVCTYGHMYICMYIYVYAHAYVYVYL